MDKKKKIKPHKLLFVVSFWCILLFGMLGAALLIFADKEQRVSENENRYLSGFPTLSAETVLDGSFMSGVESYLSDGFFLRDTLVDTSQKMLNEFSLATTEDYLSADDVTEEELDALMNDLIAEDPVLPDETVDAAESNAPVAASDDAVQSTQDAVSDDVNSHFKPVDTTGFMDMYTLWKVDKDGVNQKIYSFPIENIASVASTLNAYQAALPAGGKLHFAQVPYPQIARLLNWGVASGWGSDMEGALASLCTENVEIHSGTSLLEQPLLDQEYVYFRTDHHWTPYGAYLVASDIAASDGLPVVSYQDYNYTITNWFIGSMKDEDPSVDLSSRADALEVMHPAAPVQSFVIDSDLNETEIPLMGYERRSYTAFLYGTRGPWRRIVTGFETGRKVLVITDSYGNAFAPYLMPYYDEVHMVDMRQNYFDEERAGICASEYIERYGITDIVVLLSTASSINAAYMLTYMPLYLYF